MNIEIVGSIAACLTTTSSIPQIYQIARTKNVTAISLYYYLMLWSGILLWLIYGLSLQKNALIFGNSISLFGISIIIYYKLRYGCMKN